MTWYILYTPQQGSQPAIYWEPGVQRPVVHSIYTPVGITACYLLGARGTAAGGTFYMGARGTAAGGTFYIHSCRDHSPLSTGCQGYSGQEVKDIIHLYLYLHFATRIYGEVLN
jgi:hypothetical protein